MNDNERLKPVDRYHLFIAVRRKKENKDKQELVFRQLIRNESEDLEVLKTRIKYHSGVWRIYKTVNARDVKKALKLFEHMMIDNKHEFIYRIDYLWRSCLLKKEARADKFFHIDIDTKEIGIVRSIKDLLDLYDIEILQEKETPNGFHLITKPFNRKEILNGWKDVTISSDGYIYIDRIEVE